MELRKLEITQDKLAIEILVTWMQTAVVKPNITLMK